MKFAILSLLVVFNASCIAQNWNPFPSNFIVHFALQNNPYPEITVHSTDTMQSDTLHFNTTFERCYNCTDTTLFLRYQPIFLGYQMINYGDTNFVFQGKDTFQIKPNYPINDSWMFSDSVTATIISYEYDVVIDALDSVKIIALSSGETIKISKNFGILQFPILGTTETYNTIGIENVIGFQDFDFWSVYDFEVGNIFSYYKRSFIGNQSTGPEFNQWYSSTLIYGKTLTLAGYNYVVSDKGYEIEYLIDNNEVSNYAGSYGSTNEGYSNLTTNFFKTRYAINSDGDVVKLFGEDKIPSENTFTPNNLQCVNADTCRSNPTNAYVYFEFRQNLGATFFSLQTFESAKSFDLIGYVLNGDTSGIIISPVSNVLRQPARIEISPNPSNSVINIAIQGIDIYATSEQISLEVYDVIGRLVVEKIIERNSNNTVLDVSECVDGNYLAVLKVNGRIQARERLIIH